MSHTVVNQPNSSIYILEFIIFSVNNPKMSKLKTTTEVRREQVKGIMNLCGNMLFILWMDGKKNNQQ